MGQWPFGDVTAAAGALSGCTRLRRLPATSQAWLDGKLNGTATRWFPDGRKIVQTYDAGKLKSESKQ